MAESIVSEVLKELASLISDEISRLTGVRGELEKLQSNVRAIQAVLPDAEKRQWKEPVVREWLHKLKDVSYDIDDVLDKWRTAILKDELNDSSNSHVCAFFPTSCFSSCNKIPLRHVIADEIKELNARLDVIANEKDRYSFNQCIISSEQLVERQMTTSLINITEVKGRDEEKSKIIDMVLCESETPGPRIISIVGMGGIGKTTMAKLVYNDPEVQSHFEKRIWVCVSDPFDEIRVAKAILESLQGFAPNVGELQNILEQIKRCIEGKRFLLVLDDLWSEEFEKWEKLKCSLLCGLTGSRILATTRKENVAKIIRSNDIFPLGILSEEECWSLFSQIVFAECTIGKHEQIEGICREIVAKCKGLPLAAKTLGSLCSGKSRGELQSILESEVWEIEEAEVDLFPHLWLSYYDLPSSLRRCFSYCSVLPKDYIIEKHKLIESWMAQGYLMETRTEDMEKIGEKFFQKLATRSLFQDYQQDSEDGSIIACKMHDIVHDFAQFITKNECFVWEANGSEDTITHPFPKEARHLRIVLENAASLPISLNGLNLKKLHSLKVQCSDVKIITRVHLTNLFNELTCLRSLDLSNCKIEEIPGTISKLEHLRQLDLSMNYMLRELPETVCDLVNLQTLNISCGSDGFTKLPSRIGKLVQLRHLHNSPTVEMPKGVARLTCLRTLHDIRLGYGDANFSLPDLEKLNHLQGKLSINDLSGEADINAARQAKLKRKTQITSFSLSFTGEEAENRVHHDQQLIEALEPSTNLECLSIDRNQGKVFPSWIMSLAYLRKLNLFSCKNYEHLPPLGKLPSLESLDLFQLYSVKKVGLEFLGMEPQNDDKVPASSSLAVAFPRLTELSFSRMVNWEEWDYGMSDEATASITVMPSLRFLVVSRCSSLEALPHHLLQKAQRGELQLTIKRCISLSSCYQQDLSDLPNVSIW